jgi:hypothetical protein
MAVEPDWRRTNRGCSSQISSTKSGLRKHLVDRLGRKFGRLRPTLLCSYYLDAIFTVGRLRRCFNFTSCVCNRSLTSSTQPKLRGSGTAFIPTFARTLFVSLRSRRRRMGWRSVGRRYHNPLDFPHRVAILMLINRHVVPKTISP